MTTASKANPSYRLTKRSNTIPVQLLITMAPNSGDQPSVTSSLTCSFRRVRKKHVVATPTTKSPTIKGSGVCMKPISPVEVAPISSRVTRSPKHDATGGAILSGSVSEQERV